MTEERKSSRFCSLLEDLEFLKKLALDNVPYTAFGIKGGIEDAYQRLKGYILKNKEHREI